MSISSIGSSLSADFATAISATSASTGAKGNAATQGVTGKSSGDSYEKSAAAKSAAAKSGGASTICPKGNPACKGCGSCKSSSIGAKGSGGAGSKNTNTMVMNAIKAYETQGSFTAKA